MEERIKELEKALDSVLLRVEDMAQVIRETGGYYNSAFCERTVERFRKILNKKQQTTK